MKVWDPVCRMEIDTADAVATTEYDGETFYFCSQECAKEFESDAARYVRMWREDPPHTTTGSFTAPKFGSAGSGGAEFEPAP